MMHKTISYSIQPIAPRPQLTWRHNHDISDYYCSLISYHQYRHNIPKQCATHKESSRRLLDRFSRGLLRANTRRRRLLLRPQPMLMLLRMVWTDIGERGGPQKRREEGRGGRSQILPLIRRLERLYLKGIIYPNFGSSLKLSHGPTKETRTQNSTCRKNQRRRPRPRPSSRASAP